MTAIGTNGRYKWYSLVDEDDGTAEVLPVDYIDKPWLIKMIHLEEGMGYWATESSYDYQSPIYNYENRMFTRKPHWAVHIAWFNK